jgi:biotin carboxylase
MLLTDEAERPRLLLIGSGDRRYREYIPAALARHFALWLIDAHEVTWQAPYLEGALIEASLHDVPALIATATGIARPRPLNGVLTYDETLVHETAQVAEALALPGSSPEAVLACRDKARTRAVLARAGIPQPVSRTAATAAEALMTADAIGYPVVVKPRGMAGSMGVVRADDPAAVAAAFAAADSAVYPGAPSYGAGVLVEEYMAGPEISVDCVVAAGVCTITTLARKQVGLEPFFEETGHTVNATDPLLEDQDLRQQLTAIHQALKFTLGATHSEFKLTPDGFRLVEINARLGGDLIPYLGLLATGTDPCLAAAQVAAGQVPDTTARHQKTAAIRFLYPPCDGEVASAKVREDRLGPSVHRAVATAGPGTQLALPPRGYMSRYGYVIAVHEDSAQVVSDLSDPSRLIDLRYRARPLQRPGQPAEAVIVDKVAEGRPLALRVADGPQYVPSSTAGQPANGR